MRIRHIATFAETIRTDPVTLAREYLSARDATIHEFLSEEARVAYVDVLLALGRFQHRTAFARALAELDASSEARRSEPLPHHLMRPIAWTFGGRATYPGYTDDRRWNGFLNVWVGTATWPYVLADLIAGADGDARLIAQYRAMGEVGGMIRLTHGFGTSEVQPAWPGMFPDYPITTMVPIPATWSEMSWHYETAPSFSPCAGPMGEAAQIWIDYEEPSRREIPEAGRFTFCRRDAIGEVTVVYAGDDYAEALRHVAIEQLACDFATRLGRVLTPADWRDMRLRNRTVDAGVCASHDVVDANMVMLEAWAATRDPAIVGAGEADALGHDLDHVNAAWTIATRYYLTACEEGARFDDWRMSGRDLAMVPPSGAPARVYSVGSLDIDDDGWIVTAVNTSQRFDHLVDADAHFWSVFASTESRHG